MSKAAYEIRVLGEIPPQVLEDFDRVTVAVDPMETAVHAELVDEAELQGILDAIRRVRARARRRPPGARLRGDRDDSDEL